jgi:hypothetical protein
LNPNSSTILGVDDIANALDYDPDADDEGGIGGRWDSTWHAVEDLDAVGLLDHRDRHDVRFSSATRQIRDGAAISTVYPDLIAPYLDAEQAAFLGAALRRSETQHSDYASVIDIDARDVLTDLGWDPATVDYYGICAALDDLGFIHQTAFMGGRVDLRPTYRGDVKVTRQVATEWQERLATLVKEWETVTVDHKRELPLGTDARNAEFAKDVTSLANTKASGETRYLVIGYDDKSRAFTTPLDSAITQDRLEQILNDWSRPVPTIRLTRLPDRSGAGEVGIVEIIREPAKLPYTVAKAGGKIGSGSTFVRHGTHVVPPDADELADLIAEGDVARAS